MNRKSAVKRGKGTDPSSPRIESDGGFKTLKGLFCDLKEKYKVSGPELLMCLDREEVIVPDSVFSHDLSTFQSIVKYLKETCRLKNNEISKMLHKSQKSIWQAYDQAKKVTKRPFARKKHTYAIPVSSISPGMTVFESVVAYLREQIGLGYHQIGIALKRDERTVWTVYHRAKKRGGA